MKTTNLFETVALKDITKDERFREDFGDLTELKADIKEKGLLHPIVINDPDGSRKKFKLLAGGRRLEAYIEMEMDKIFAHVYVGEIDELMMRMIELSENLHRKDLTPYETLMLTYEIHKLREKKYGKHSGERWLSDTGASIQETADMLGRDRSAVSKEVQAAELLSFFPELVKAKTKKEIFDTVKKAEKRFVEKKVTDKIEQETAETPDEIIKERLCSWYIIGDFNEEIRSVEDNIISLCEVDPPYGISLEDKKKRKSKAGSDLDIYQEIDAEVYLPFMKKVLTNCYRVSKPDAWLILWYGIEPWQEDIFKLATEIGYKGRRLHGTWYKYLGQTQQPTSYLASDYETFYYFAKGNPSIHKPGTCATFGCTADHPSKKRHDTQRPIALIQRLLETFCPPGALILSPFLGSGNTLLAATNANMTAFGYDLGQEFRNSYVVKVHEGSVPYE